MKEPMSKQPAADIGRQHAREVNSGERFEFGKNWAAFLESLNEERIAEARRSLAQMLETDSLAGRRFLDIGSGSGLFSLAARGMGASVFSFDYDTHSAGCTRELRRRYFPGDPAWTVEHGSVLDKDYLAQLGQFDIVYSWGVLHHTGAMWQALENIVPLVAPKGKLFIALYNDQGGPSRRWLWVKRTYCKYPPLRYPLLIGSAWRLLWRSMLKDLLLRRPGHTFRQYRKDRRGMSLWRDIVDWVGGYPFEVAKAEEVLAFYRRRGFVLINLITDNDIGCNQFVFLNHGEIL
jgi:2-polyprenyl-6-hydroxyphenyl methylase/3-demethylubiquinone-9 3-methyltransferase